MALAPGIDYSTLTYDGKPLPGQYFFCQSYRVTLNTEACATRHREAQANARWLETGHKLFECVTCPIGHTHAGAENPMQPARDTHCVRCGCGFQRLIDASLCISCYNRQREVVAGKNAKGGFPSNTASQLFWVRAIIRAGSECAPPLFGQTGLNGLPTLEALGDDCWWFDGVTGGREEFDRLLATRWAHSTVDSIEFSPSILEMHLGESADTQTVSAVTRRTLEARLRRHLAKDGLGIRKCREGTKLHQDFGAYVLVDLKRRCILHKPIDLEGMSRWAGLLKQSDQMAEDMFDETTY